MKKYRTITSVFVLALLWEILAVQINNDFLFPYPLEVGKMMLQQVTSVHFYQVVAATLYRSLLGLGIAFLAAFLCAYLSYRYTVFHDLFYPVLLLTRSVPNVAYIIIILVWFGAEKSAAIVSFLIIFPIIYANLNSGLNFIDPNLKKVMQLYPERERTKICRLYIPLLRSAMEASLTTGLSLTFKVGVMAEILGQVQVGIGRQLNLCRITTNVTGIFAWTLWIIVILLLMEIVMHLLFHRQKRMHS